MAKPQKTLGDFSRRLRIVFELTFWLVIPYFVLATTFVMRRFDPLYKGVTPLKFGLIAMAVFVSGYPIFVWKRKRCSEPLK